MWRVTDVIVFQLRENEGPVMLEVTWYYSKTFTPHLKINCNLSGKTYEKTLTLKLQLACQMLIVNVVNADVDIQNDKIILHVWSDDKGAAIISAEGGTDYGTKYLNNSGYILYGAK